MFEIDFQDDMNGPGIILRIRDATRYVQMSIKPGEWIVPGQTWEERVATRMAIFNELCEKWYIQFGKRIKPIPPEAPGVMWSVVADE